MQQQRLSTIAAHFVLKGPKEASFVALLTGLIPFLSWCSVVVVCFVTLRQGAKRGALVLPWAMLGSLVYLFPDTSISEILFSLSVNYLLAYGLACQLRVGFSWSFIIASLVILALVGIVIASIVCPNYQDIYVNKFLMFYKTLNQEGLSQISIEQITQVFAVMKHLVFGLIALGMTANVLFNLIVARSIQASSFNPGGLGMELRQLKGHKLYVLLLFIGLVGVFLGWSLAYNLLMVAAWPLAVFGLCVVHVFIENYYKHKKAVLVAFYIFFVVFTLLSFLPFIMVVLIGLVDCFIDIRQALSFNSAVIK